MQRTFLKLPLIASGLVFLSACSIESGRKAPGDQEKSPAATGGSSELPSQTPVGGSGGAGSVAVSLGGETSSGGVAATGGQDPVDVLVPEIPVVITEVKRGSIAYVELLNTSAEEVSLSGVELSWGVEPDATTLSCQLGDVSIGPEGFLILHDGEECPWSASPCVTGCPVKPVIRPDWDVGSDLVYLTIAGVLIDSVRLPPEGQWPVLGETWSLVQDWSKWVGLSASPGEQSPY